MNVYLREMKAHRKSLILWSFGVFLLIVTGMAKFAGYESSGQSINDLVSHMPKALQSLLGMGAFDLSTAKGFYGTLSLYFFVMAAIHGALVGANIISKEELDKTAEFLFAKPISRNKVITQKILAAITNLIVFNGVALITSLVIVGYYSKEENFESGIIYLMAGMLILQLIYLFIGTGIGAMSKRPKKSATIATSLLLMTFILSIVIDLNSNLENLKYFTPFKYFEAKNVMFEAGFEWVYVVLSIVIIIVFVCMTYVFYRKKDLNV